MAVAGRPPARYDRVLRSDLKDEPMPEAGLTTLLDELKAAIVEVDAALDAAHDRLGAGPEGPVEPAAPDAKAAGATFIERAADYAARHPLTVLAGAAALGYLVGRLHRRNGAP